VESTESTLGIVSLDDVLVSNISEFGRVLFNPEDTDESDKGGDEKAFSEY